VLYLRLIIFLVGDDVFIDSETFLVTDFVNLKIKSTQSFRDTHRDTIYMHIFIGVNVHMCMNIYVSTIFLTKKNLPMDCWISLGPYSVKMTSSSFFLPNGH
jgi:hypothetical protein